MGCMPDCIIVKFDSYKGLVSASDSESKCVAIKPIKTNWKVYGNPVPEFNIHLKLGMLLLHTLLKVETMDIAFWIWD